jgi:predicted transcriptional regulator
MARFGELEAAIMDVVWAVRAPVRVREVSEQLNRDRPLAFNTVQTVMEILYRKGWLGRHKDGRAYRYEPAGDPAATLVRLVGDLEPGEAARLRAALDAAIDRGSPR